MKKFATIIGSAALFAAAVLPAMATGNNCGNDTTGPFSDNTCTINNTSNVSVKNYNDAKVDNKVDSHVNTGGNSANYNTLGGDIVTGNATSNTVVSTVANVNTTRVVGGPTAGGNTGSNHITGPGAGAYGEFGYNGGNNAVYINNDKTVDVDNQNTAVVKNDVDASSNTGDNSAKDNTGPAFIRSGNAYMGVSVANHVNDNLTDVMTGAGSSGNSMAGNDTTGPFSNNVVTLNTTNTIGVRNYNDMLVKNYIDASSETGDNKADYNTLGGDIVTGMAHGVVGVNTEGNINTTSVEQAMGGFANQGYNSITGAGSENDTYVNNDQMIQVDNANNKCWSHNADSVNRGRDCNPWDLGVTNNVDASADAGDNSANGNTAGGFVNATMADLWQSVVTHMNDTMTTITQ